MQKDTALEKLTRWEGHFLHVVFGLFLGVATFVVALVVGATLDSFSWLQKVVYAPTSLILSLLADGPESIQSVLRDVDPIMQFVVLILSPVIFWSVIWFVLLCCVRVFIGRKNSR